MIYYCMYFSLTYPSICFNNILNKSNSQSCKKMSTVTNILISSESKASNVMKQREHVLVRCATEIFICVEQSLFGR
jgi:transglutaminase/protease-like cytokinesis protein 3